MSKLKNLTDEAIKNARQSRNVYSEDLSMACFMVSEIDDPKLQRSFDKLLTHLLTDARENVINERSAQHSDFGNRQNIGIGVCNALSSQNDLSVLDRFTRNSNGGTASERTVELVETLADRIEIYHEKCGFESLRDIQGEQLSLQKTQAPAYKIW